MSDALNRLSALEDALKEAFKARDIDKVMTLDTSFQNVLKDIRQSGLQPPTEQVERLKALYIEMREHCQNRCNELSEKMNEMRQERNALGAYKDCLVSGSQ